MGNIIRTLLRSETYAGWSFLRAGIYDVASAIVDAAASIRVKISVDKALGMCAYCRINKVILCSLGGLRLINAW